MRLAYLDESYTQDHFFIGAVVVGEHPAAALTRRRDAVAEGARAAYLPQLLNPPELHGHPLFQGVHEWKSLKPRVRALISVYDQAMRAIGDQDLHIFLRGLDRRRHRLRYTQPRAEHEVVLHHLLERLNDFGHSLGEQILVIADEITDPNELRARLTEFRRIGTPGYRPSHLEHILDTLHFAPSTHSRLLQAADLVTFIHRRRRTIKESDRRQAAAIERIWSHVECRVRHEWLHVPQTHEGPARGGAQGTAAAPEGTTAPAVCDGTVPQTNP